MVDSSDFSICLAPYDTHDSRLSGTMAGALTMGGIMSSLHIHRQMVYAQLSRRPSSDLTSTTSQYDVDLRGVYLRGHQGGTSVVSRHKTQTKDLMSVYNETSTAVLDSLRRETILAPDVYDALVGRLNEFASFDQVVSKSAIRRLPTILMQFKEASRRVNISHKKQEATAEALGSM